MPTALLDCNKEEHAFSISKGICVKNKSAQIFECGEAIFNYLLMANGQHVHVRERFAGRSPLNYFMRKAIFING